MTGIRMLQVMLAVMLFSTTLISVYTALGLRNQMIYKVVVLQQGHKLADRYLQSVQADLLGQLKTFHEVHDFYNPAVEDSIEIWDEKYYYNIESNYCSPSGDILNPDSGFQRIDIRVVTIPDMIGDSVRIGTQSEPVNRVFADMY